MAKKKKRKTSKRAVEEAQKAQKKSVRNSKRAQISKEEVQPTSETPKKSSKGYEELPMKDIKKDLVKTLGYSVFSFGVVVALYLTDTGLSEISSAASTVGNYIQGIL